MMHGKREMPREHRSHKGLTALIALALILCCTIGGTVAWLATSTDPVINTFTPTSVGTDIDEKIFGKSKESVIIKNTGDVSAYIRAAVIVNWVDDEGKVYVSVPAEAQYELEIQKSNGWFQVGDYYYYKDPVPKGGSAKNLLTATEKENAPAGYHLQVTILAEAIQADGQSSGTPAVETVWPVKVNSDKTLIAKS